ncbi:MAG: hypothetical protein V1886_02385 [archaeon]
MAGVKINVYFSNIEVPKNVKTTTTDDGVGYNPPVYYEHVDLSKFVKIPENCSFDIYRDTAEKSMKGHAEIKPHNNQLKLTDILMIPVELEKKGFRFEKEFRVEPFLSLNQGGSSCTREYEINKWNEKNVAGLCNIIKDTTKEDIEDLIKLRIKYIVGRTKGCRII